MRVDAISERKNKICKNDDFLAEDDAILEQIGFFDEDDAVLELYCIRIGKRMRSFGVI